MSPQTVFLDLLIAAMKDAATQGKLTLFKSTIGIEGEAKPRLVRIIIIPEEMDYEWPKDQPAGTDAKKN